MSTRGRICLFGEHQDYLGLPVIAMAISLRAKLLAKKDRQKVIIHMPDIERTERFDLNDMEYRKEKITSRAEYAFVKEGLSFASGLNAK